jgi:hypothetical protein
MTGAKRPAKRLFPWVFHLIQKRAILKLMKPPGGVDMSRRRIVVSAHDVVQDIKSGMDDEALMIKYRLSFRQLQRLFRKIIIGGFIAPMELAERLCVTKSQVGEAFVDLKKGAKDSD